MAVFLERQAFSNAWHKFYTKKCRVILKKKLCTTATPLSMSKWTSVVGLEIHAQILSNSKLFSGAGTEFGLPVNTSVSLFDAAIPGTLPVLNRRCVEAGVLTALSLSCRINAMSLFDRKHYFYSDLPAGYQITQQRLPLAQGGQIDFHVFTQGVHKKPYKKTARIHQLQLEQDSGKSLHDEILNRSLVDLNRAGLPLMEIVFEPDLNDGEEAAALVQELVLILQRLGTCSCKMEEGALRVDANVSLHQSGEPLGVRTEIKNIGSVRAVANAIKYEIDRQRRELENGHTIVNETRAWDAESKQTVSVRDKEQVQDYRYMPEPNLPPLWLLIDDKPLPENVDSRELVNVEALRKELPEMPEETRNKLIQNYALSLETVFILVRESKLLQYFEDIMKENPSRNPQRVAKILIMDFLTALNKKNVDLDNCQVPASFLGELIDMLQNDVINLQVAKKVLEELLTGPANSPSEIVNLNQWSQIIHPDEINKICRDVILKNPKLVKQYKNGKKKVLKALLGEAARSTNERVKMSLVEQQLKAMLDKE
ncbi:glutamyl-tRNA(Gln) amidotransferase subunit B, mitochondrial isoform X1 [Schistocerca gregaria]|uniref:glutamyl-tRNA(Gln) amidotransferase subunit B, mitochondrial isoform X1 n=1 Tax=Schistocerca gregaria TaxID=7010 RepID=UPI00211EF2BE|nr:glutamyl-tRNA(Gln) amidotransferase subunit B, mitochondrial isoform X1 [Schistocerca gregaria]